MIILSVSRDSLYNPVKPFYDGENKIIIVFYGFSRDGSFIIEHTKFIIILILYSIHVYNVKVRLKKN